MFTVICWKTEGKKKGAVFGGVGAFVMSTYIVQQHEKKQ